MICNDCGCEFAAGASMCPQCTSESARMKGDDDMAKITVHGGPTDVDQEVSDEWDGSKPSTSSEKDETTESDSSLSDPSPAPTTESPSSSDQTESSSADSTGGETADPYDSWTKEDLQAELADRELPVSGNKAAPRPPAPKQRIARLREDDAKDE